jgi:peptide-methionine (R)-S-oxide reductase
MNTRTPAIATLLILSLGLSAPAEEPKKPATTDKKMDSTKPEVVKSDEEWLKVLTPEQFRVTRLGGTEPPNGPAYHQFEKQGEGTYYCVCCGAELFTSDKKFHSGCGWPSFSDASKAKNVLEKPDNSHGMKRVETVCKRCDAHLGHVFDGEGFGTPTDRRFCINAAALNFVPKGGKAPELLPVTSDEVRKKREEVAKKGGVEIKK